MPSATASAAKKKKVSKKDMNVTLSFLNTVHGDKEVKYEDKPEDREKLSQKLETLMRKGTACFLRVGKGHSAKDFKIKGYDKETNEWVVLGTPQKIPAKGTKVIVVAPQSGG